MIEIDYTNDASIRKLVDGLEAERERLRTAWKFLRTCLGGQLCALGCMCRRCQEIRDILNHRLAHPATAISPTDEDVTQAGKRFSSPAVAEAISAAKKRDEEIKKCTRLTPEKMTTPMRLE